MSSNSKKPFPQARIGGIDFLRGCLILLVIIGHIALGTIHDNWLRYSIYAFHMPLFIGLTGYLLNSKAFSASSFIELARRYWWRLIVPFSFAFVFFTGILLLHAYQEGRVTIGLLISYLHTPYYHLWFIPTMVIWVLMYRLILQIHIPLWCVFLIFSAVSLYWACLAKPEQLIFLAPLASKKVSYFFSFFLFGAWLRSLSLLGMKSLFTQLRWLTPFLVIVLSWVYLQYMGLEKSMTRGFAWFILNLLLIAWLVPMSKSTTVKSGKLCTSVVAIGRNSLPIYLWHVVPLFLLKGFDIHQTKPLLYYIISIITIMLIVKLVLRFETHNTTSDRLVYGV